MAKYSKAAAKKVEAAMKEMKKGALKTGSGKKVTDKKQAIAIGLSEAKKKGAKVPAKKTATKKATPAKKVAARKVAPAKKAIPAKKVAAKKPAKKKAAPAKKEMPFKKGAAKKVATKKVVAKKSITKKTAQVNLVNKNISAAKNKAPKETPKKIIIPLPEKEEINNNIPVEEPYVPAAIKVELKGNPIPQNIYSVSGDNYHGHIKPSTSKSKIKPSGKKPLWNK